MSCYQFGVFRFESQERRLIAPSGAVDLRSQVALALEFLLRERHRTVTRDELIQHLWPDTIVQEQNLAFCISELRRVLGDDAKNPNFIKTVPKLGYRWVCEPTDDVSELPAEASSPVPKPRSLVPVSILVTLVVLVAGVIWFASKSQPNASARVHQDPPLDAIQRVAFLPFLNASGETSLKWVELGLMDMVAEACSTSYGIEVVPSEQVIQIYRDFAKPAEGGNHAIILCERLGADLVVENAIRRSDQVFVAEYTIHTKQGTSTTRQLEDKNLLELANQLSRSVSQRAAPDQPVLELIDRFALDSYVNISYASGLQVYLTDGPKHALSYFENCLQREPDFLLAKLQIARAYRTIGRADEARAILTDLVEESQKRNDPLVTAHAVGILSVLYMQAWDLDESERLVQQAMDIYTSLNERTSAAICRGQLGYLAYAREDNEQAERLLLETLKIVRQAGDHLSEAGVLNTLALVYDAYADYDRIVEYQGKSLDLYQLLGSRPGIALVTGNLATFAMQYGDLDAALPGLNNAMDLYRESGDQHGVKRIHFNLSIIEATTGNLKEAIEHCEQGVAIARQLDDPVMASQLLIQQARYEMDLFGQRTQTLVEAWQTVEPLGYELLNNYYYCTTAYVAMREGDYPLAHTELERVSPPYREEHYEYFYPASLLAFHEGDITTAKAYLDRLETHLLGFWREYISVYHQVYAGKAPMPQIGFHKFN